MSKSIRIPDEVYDYIMGEKNAGEKLGATIMRLINVERSGGRGAVRRAKNHVSLLMPREVYTYTILEAFGLQDGTKLSTGDLQKAVDSRVHTYGLLEWFTADGSYIGNRPRWKIRFTSALRQLVVDNCLIREDDGKYSITSNGSDCLWDVYLHIDADARQCYMAALGDWHDDTPKRLPDWEIPEELKEHKNGLREHYISRTKEDV